MGIGQMWRRGRKAFGDTANLVAFLSIVTVGSILTLDSFLLIVGVVLEVFYLGLSIAFGTRRLDSCSRMVDFLDRVLLVITVAGFVVILFFGFGKHLLNHPLPYFTHAQGWEAGAIIWTGLFLVYYVTKFRDISSRPVNTVAKGVLLLLSGWLLGAAGYSIRSGGLLQTFFPSLRRPLEHVIYVSLIGVCFLFTDLLIMVFHDDPKEKVLSRASLFWADIPMVVSFLVLFVYLLVHGDTENPEVFVSGVVACQLLISNAVFVVMEFGLLRPSKP